MSLTEGELRNVYLPPFAAAVAAGAGNVMTSYIGIDGVPGAADRRLITDVLRGELGFDGFVVSDAASVMDLVTHGFARDERDAAVRALRAGLDMEMWTGVRIAPGADPAPLPGAFSTLADAVRSGEVDQALLDAAARRVLLLKLRLGLFERPYVDETATAGVLSDPTHRETARVAATGTPVVLVLLSGRPLDLRRALERSSAILAAWHPGCEGGLAVARLLFGDATPGGRLPLSWPRSVGQAPLIYARLTSHQPSTSHQRYWEEESTPLFPFGFGLSYGQVEYRNLSLSAPQIGLDDTLEATVELHNTSSRTVEEVAQLYLHQRYGRAARPVRELKGFQRVTLEPGEACTLRFAIPAAARRYWSAADRAYVLDETSFDVWVGGAATAELHATFEVRGGEG